MTKGQKQVRSEAPPSVNLEPIISNSRYVTLRAKDAYRIKLSHLRALMREADVRGFADDTNVSVRSAPGALGFGTEAWIQIGGES